MSLILLTKQKIQSPVAICCKNGFLEDTLPILEALDGMIDDVYMQGAMDMFAGMPKERIGKIVMEIAQLGQRGLKINEPEVRYTLANLDGDFSGLQLLCQMHTGFRLFDPNSDTGTGLDREYEAAVAMRSKG